MRRTTQIWLGIVFSVFTLVIALVACSQKEREGELLMAPNPQKMAQAPAEPPPKEIKVLEELPPAYFDTDKYDLRPDAKKTMAENAEWLKKHPDVKVQIEGACDERGTRAYNLILGDNRAKAAYEYMISLGIGADRMEIISYGAMPGQNRKIWASQRRASFILIHPRKELSQKP